MRIRELRLFNYRVFEDEHFVFDDRFTVIAGINGRGKTALLDALALLFSRFLPLISPSRSPYRMIRPSELHLDANQAGLVMKVNCAGFPIEYELAYTRESRKIKSTHLSGALRDEVRKAYSDPSRADDAAPIAVYYTTDRAGYRLPKKLPNDVPGGQAAAYTGALFNRIVDFRDFMARYRATIVLENERRLENPCYLGGAAVEAISRALQSFLGGFTNLRVEEGPLRLLIDKEGVPLDLTQLSDGERSFLAILCDLGRRLALANPLLPNPLHGDGIVLIDELELHLHPKWQRTIVEHLTCTFPGCQFIATTHSPQIVASVEPEQVLLLTDMGVVRPERTLGMDSNWILRHLMEADDRPEYAAKAISAVETLITKGTFEKAREEIAKSRETGLDLPEWSVLEARMTRMEMLGE